MTRKGTGSMTDTETFEKVEDAKDTEKERQWKEIVARLAPLAKELKRTGEEHLKAANALGKELAIAKHFVQNETAKTWARAVLEMHYPFDRRMADFYIDVSAYWNKLEHGVQTGEYRTIKDCTDAIKMHWRRSPERTAASSTQKTTQNYLEPLIEKMIAVAKGDGCKIKKETVLKMLKVIREEKFIVRQPTKAQAKKVDVWDKWLDEQAAEKAHKGPNDG